MSCNNEAHQVRTDREQQASPCHHLSILSAWHHCPGSSPLICFVVRVWQICWRIWQVPSIVSSYVHIYICVYFSQVCAFCASEWILCACTDLIVWRKCVWERNFYWWRSSVFCSFFSYWTAVMLCAALKFSSYDWCTIF